MNVRRWISFLLPAVIVVITAFIVLVAPEEKTLGTGIKSIYVHVALTWTGMFGLSLVGFLGVITLLTARSPFFDWAQTIGWVAIVAFVAGLVMSMVAAQINWGGIFWAEPRTQAAMRIVSVALIVQILNTWFRNVRLRGLLHIIPSLFMAYTILTTELVLHPRSPILTSDSVSIQLTFVSLFLLVAAVAGWFVWYLVPRMVRKKTSSSL